MWGRWLGYLAAVLGCLILYIFYTQWAVWVLLWWLICLPVLSLLLSLPAMVKAEFSLEAPQRLPQGAPGAVQLQVQCRFPLPVYKCRLALRHCITQERFYCVPGEKLDTTHCGAQEISVKELRVYDYFGLVFRTIKGVSGCVVLVEPVPVAMEDLPRQGGTGGALRPKPGGGFSEEHELRQYVPGDDLRQIHWKLTAKTGKPVVRQPLQRLTSARLLTVALCGTPEEIDRKLGRLLWLSNSLLQRGEGHEAAVLSARGLERFSIIDANDLHNMLDAVLTAAAVAPDSVVPEQGSTLSFAIGGEADGA